MNNVRHHTGAGFAYQRGLLWFWHRYCCFRQRHLSPSSFNSPDNRIRVFRDFVNYRETPYDDNGHGTHIAGIISGNGYLSKGRYMGMAPKSHLIILKILDHHGNGTAETVCRAIEWTVRHQARFHIRIMNISIGAKANQLTVENRMLTDAVEYAWDHGLIVVAAAGNNGPALGSITLTGNKPEGDHCRCRTGDILARRAEEQLYFLRKRAHKNCICKPEILAPGFQICSCGNHKEHPYTIRSGTSMASPVVSGGIALILDQYPDLTNKEVKRCLLKSARPLTLPEILSGMGIVPYSGMLRRQM
ncbi:MAG: S8 family serine peptidase [Coprococcus sp.]